MWRCEILMRRPSVASVAAGSEAEIAGLAVGDDILEIDGHAAGSDFERRLAELRPGDKLHLRVRQAKSGKPTKSGERDVNWKLALREQVSFELKDLDNITPQQRARRTAWLKGDTGMSGASRP